MKKVSLFLGAIVFIGAIMTGGCSPAPVNPSESKPTIVGTGAIADKYAQLPEWARKPMMDKEYLGASASATIGQAGVDFALSEASSKASTRLSEILGNQVAKEMEIFAQTTGIGKGETLDKVTKETMNTFSNRLLVGCQQKDMYIAGNEVFVWMVMPKDNVEKEAIKAVQTSMSNEKAMSQIMQANTSQDNLKKRMGVAIENAKAENAVVEAKN